MKISVAKSDLEIALKVAAISVDSSVNDLSSHYLFRVTDTGAEVLSYGPRLFSCAPFTSSCDGEPGEAFTVEAWRLDKWMAGVADGVLELSFDGSGDVHARGKRSKVRFRSLNPSKFPYWDGLMSEATDVGEVDPRVLNNAMKFARIFVSADDTAKPELCQLEGIEGSFWATDRRGLANVEVRSLENLHVRIPGKDSASLMKFLGDKDTMANSVSLKKAERSAGDGGGAFAVFKRPDGSYLGVSRPTSNFPTLKVDRDSTPQTAMTLDVAEFDAGVAVLSAGAPKGHESVTFSYDQDSGVVSIAMPSEAGGQDEYPLSLAKVSEGGENFDTAFTVDIKYVNEISSVLGLEVLNLGLVRKGRGGYVTCDHNEEAEDGNRYFGVIVWRT
jgi:hypothetical protein